MTTYHQIADSDEANLLLKLVPPAEYDRLNSALELIDMPLQQVFVEPDQEPRFVYFPQKGMLSVVTVLRDGNTVEAATVGREGFAGLPIFLGGNSNAHRLVVQLRGSAKRVDAKTFLQLLPELPTLDSILKRYTLARLRQVTQTAACNTLHTVDKRCSRWLLMCHDRAGEDEFLLTQEFLSQMLGVRRAGVTIAAGALQKQSLIRYTRGRIRILDRAGLEKSACECYAAIRKSENDLIASPPESVVLSA